MGGGQGCWHVALGALVMLMGCVTVTAAGGGGFGAGGAVMQGTCLSTPGTHGKCAGDASRCEGMLGRPGVLTAWMPAVC